MATPVRSGVRLLEKVEPETGREELVRVYVWQRPVRITHWAIAFSTAVLAVTGLYIGNPIITAPGEAASRFVMGWMKIVHYNAAIVFTAALFARLVWMFAGNRYARWDQFIPVSRVRRKAAVQSFLFYVWKLRKPPGVVGHNPLAGLAYVGVFSLELVMVVTGLAMYGASADTRSVLHVFAGIAPMFGGLMWMRWIHHIVMWLLLGFVVQHVYSSILVAVVERNATLDSIISGMKVMKEKDLVEPIPEENREGEPT